MSTNGSNHIEENELKKLLNGNPQNDSYNYTNAMNSSTVNTDTYTSSTNSTNRTLTPGEEKSFSVFVGVLGTLIRLRYIIPAIGLVAILLFGLRFIKQSIDYEKGTDIKATITNIVPEERVRDDRKYTAYVSYVTYEYKGKKYENKPAGTVESTTRIGEEKTIRINDKEPDKVYTGDGFSGKILGGFLIVFSIIGIIQLVKRRMQEG